MALIQRDTDYALRALAYLARTNGSGETTSMHRLAEMLDIPEDFLRKIAQKLAACGIVESVRGRFGGIRLGRPAESIALFDVMRALDSVPAVNRCFTGDGACPNQADCALRARLHPVKDAVEQIFRDVMLAAVVAGPTPARRTRGRRR